jgi:hypothetical protein
MKRASVSTVGMPTRRVAAPIVVLGASGLLGWMVLSAANRPPRAAGLVQRTCRPGSVVRPNSVSAGTGASNVENATTQ